MDRSTLNKATSSDEVPTPGYLFTEIAKSTFEDVNACQQLADYLLKKLERDDPLVKVKVLRIIRHVCDQGKPDFRRSVQKRADLVKSCLQYRGRPDALKGDAPNKAVRDEAETAVKSVFSSDTNTNAYGASHFSGPKMQGFGNDSADGNMGGGGGYGGGGYGGGGCSGFGGSNNTYGRGPSSFGSSGPPGGGGGMVGFGNPNFDNSPPAEKDSMLKSAMTGAFSAASTLASKVPGVGSMINTQEPQMDTKSSSYAPPTAGGHPSGGFGSGPGSFGGAPGNGGFGTGVQGRWGADAPPSQRAGGYGGAAPPAHKEAGEYEARVVSELCAPGGPRVAPAETALSEFARKCESLDANCIGDQLRQKLGAPDWQTRLKALYAVESLQQHGLDGIVGHVSQFSSELLFECQEMPQCRQKASKVLQALGFIDQADQPATKTSAPAAAAAAPVDLLDMGDGSAAPPAAAPPAAGGGGLGDLLDGGALAPALLSNGYVPPTTAASDILDMGGGAAPAPAGQVVQPAPAPAEGGGLFGSLSMASGAAAPALAQAAVGVDLAASAQTSDPTAVAGGGLFGNLQLGGASSAAPATQTSPSPVLNSVQGGGSVPAPLSPATQLQQQLQQQLLQQLTPEQQQQQELAARRAHLSVLSGGASMGAPMQQVGGPMAGSGAFPGAIGGMMGGVMMPSMMSGMPQAMPGAMGMQPQMQMQMQMPMHPQMQQQMMGANLGAMGMQQPMSQQPHAIYAGAPAAQAGAGGLGGPSSAFGFIGGCGAAPPAPMGGGVPPPMGMASPIMQPGSQPAPAPAVDNAFSFVADQMKGASA